jgi:two-component system sensor histidine kinase BaeS
VRSLAFRIFLLVGGAVLISGAVITAIHALKTRSALDAQATRNFARQADALATVAVDRGSRNNQIFYLTASGLVALPRRGQIASPELGAVRDSVLAGLRSGHSGSVDTPAGEVLLATRNVPGGKVVLARDASRRSRGWQPALTSLIAPALAAVLIAAGAALLLARRLIRPLAELSEATSRMAAGDHSARVSVRGDDELARLGASFNAMVEEVSRSRQRERELVLAVSHDFRTPLTSVRGYAEALGEGAVGAPQAAEAIEEEARRLDRLVSDLLDLGRSGQGALSFNLRPVDLGGVARDLEARFSRTASDLGLTLEVDDDAAGSVLADHDRLIQVASNLIENAIRATPPGGKVILTAIDRRLEIGDTGPGLDREDQAKAFERYYLYRRYRNDRAVGTGLGLAIVKQFTEQMNGRVWLESDPGRGATFFVELPASPT